MLDIHFSHSKLISLQTTARLEEGLREDYASNAKGEAQFSSADNSGPHNLQRTV